MPEILVILTTTRKNRYVFLHLKSAQKSLASSNPYGGNCRLKEENSLRSNFGRSHKDKTYIFSSDSNPSVASAFVIISTSTVVIIVMIMN